MDIVLLNQLGERAKEWKWLLSEVVFTPHSLTRSVSFGIQFKAETLTRAGLRGYYGMWKHGE